MFPSVIGCTARMRVLQRLLPLSIAVLLLASGCAGYIRELSPDEPFDADEKDAIIVLRVTPRALVVLVRGKFDRYGWRPKGVVNRREIWSQDGFVVAKVTPTKPDEGRGACLHLCDGAVVSEEEPLGNAYSNPGG